MDMCDQSFYFLFIMLAMILLLFWGHEPCIGFFLWQFNTPDTLICYPGSIEKLKLLGATYYYLQNHQSSCWAAAVPAAAVTAAVAAGSGGSLMAFCFVPLCRCNCAPLRESQSNLVNHHVAQARVEAVSGMRISSIRCRNFGVSSAKDPVW
jgi:hypothetical protein